MFSEIRIKLYSLSIMSLTCIKHNLSDFHYVPVGLAPLQGTFGCDVPFNQTFHYLKILSCNATKQPLLRNFSDRQGVNAFSGH